MSLPIRPRGRGRRHGNPRRTPAWLPILLVVLAAACASTPEATDDPLQPEPTDVDEEEIAPPPLRPSWSVRPDDEALPLQPPRLGHERLYLVYADRIVSRHVAGGQVAESFHPPGRPTLAPVVLADGLAVATAEHLLLLTPDLRIRERRPLPRPAVALASLGLDLVIVDPEGLRRIGTGPRWSTTLVGATSAIARDDRLFVTAAGGRLHCIDAGTGEVLWTWTATGDLPAAPAVSGERLYVAGTANEMVALAVADGRTVWRRRLGADVVGSPVVADELVWVAGLDALLVAFTSSGTEIYRIPLRSRTYVGLARHDAWVVVAPQYGPWTLVLPARRRTSMEPGSPTVETLDAEPEIVHPPVAADAGVALVDGAGWVTLLQSEPPSP